MRYLLPFTMILICLSTRAQQVINTPVGPNTQSGAGNIYTIKQQYLANVLHNPNDKNESGADNDLERFNRWFNLLEPRCYPAGDLPRPDAVLRATEEQRRAPGGTARITSGSVWQPLGPTIVPSGFFGIGRINCAVLNPNDTNTIYVGTACGGVWITHDGGVTWTTSCDNFPSLSIADIAIDPNHPDTIYAATGDVNGSEGYGGGSLHFEDIFWGGLYSAGVMKSTDGGSTWSTTGLSYYQANRDIIQRLLIEPNHPNTLIASSRTGIYRTTDGGGTWAVVDTNEVFSMELHPSRPDTIYASGHNLRVSYNAGLTWQILYSYTESMGRLAVSPVSPKSIWIWNLSGRLEVSHDEGQTFSILTSPASLVDQNDTYGSVLGVAPNDSDFIYAAGVYMATSVDGGFSWSRDTGYFVHPDHHGITFNPVHPSTFYVVNDGGIFVTRDKGNTWADISNGLVISQVYRMSSSRQNPYIMLAGLQDNSSFYNDGTSWLISNMPIGDGMACAISPENDFFQVASRQIGLFDFSTDQGATFNTVPLYQYGYWTAPVAFNPNYSDTIYFGLEDIFASYDGGATVNNLTSSIPFPYGAISLAIAPSNPSVIYAADFGHIMMTRNAGLSWTDVTGSLPTSSLALTDIAVDYANPMLVYVTFSGYYSSRRVYVSSSGGVVWSNISYNLPNVPANCIATDCTTPGALFVGNDMGVYYTDSAHSGSWAVYNTGLPNVIVDDLEINYTNYKIRAATYGRGIWECNLVRPRPPLGVKTVVSQQLRLYPNPATNNWKVVFTEQKPADFAVRLSDASGRVLKTQSNSDIVDAAKLASGAYYIEVTIGEQHFNLKAIKE